jgi:hypothetical protein
VQAGLFQDWAVRIVKAYHVAGILATIIVATQLIVTALLWFLDPLILMNQREIGILLAMSLMMYASVSYLYLGSRRVLTLNFQWVAAALSVSAIMLMFLFFPYV